MTKWWEKEPVRFECQADCFKCCCTPGQNAPTIRHMFLDSKFSFQKG